MKLFRFLSWTAPKIALSHVNRLGRGTLADGVNGIVPLGGLKGVGARPRTTHPLAKRLTGPENRGGGGGGMQKSKPQTQRPSRKLPASGPAVFSGGHTDTEQIYRARKQLPMPSKGLSNFSPGGRTGYAKQLGALQAPWEKN